MTTKIDHPHALVSNNASYKLSTNYNCYSSIKKCGIFRDGHLQLAHPSTHWLSLLLGELGEMALAVQKILNLDPRSSIQESELPNDYVFAGSIVSQLGCSAGSDTRLTGRVEVCIHPKLYNLPGGQWGLGYLTFRPVFCHKQALCFIPVCSPSLVSMCVHHGIKNTD